MALTATKHLAHALVPSHLSLLSLHMGVPGIHSGQAPCPHAPVPRASCPAVLFTQRIAPVSCFPWTWLSSSYSVCLCLSSPCISSCLFGHLQGLPRHWVHPHQVDGPALHPDGSTSLWRVVWFPLQSFYSLCQCCSSGKYSLECKRFGHCYDFFLERDEMTGLKISFEVKNEENKMKATTTHNIKCTSFMTHLSVLPVRHHSEVFLWSSWRTKAGFR